MNLNQQKENIRNLLKDLVDEFSSDFVALALYDSMNQEFRWRLAIGSLNNRYEGIVVRRGKGVCGNVLKTKREVLISAFPEEIEDDPLNYPIMVVENLKSAMAIPLFFDAQSLGVLLVGQRVNRIYKEDEVHRLKEQSNVIIQVYNEIIKAQESQEKNEEPSYLITYLLNEKKEKRRNLTIEVLDQRISMMSTESQISLIQVFEIIFELVYKENTNSNLSIIFERKNDQQLSIHVVTDYKLDISYNKFSILAEKVGKVKGNIEIYSEQNNVHLIINLFIGLLSIEYPWNF